MCHLAHNNILVKVWEKNRPATVLTQIQTCLPYRKSNISSDACFRRKKQV